ncbi:MAG: DNRLRE domain-containing protein [Propionibacteriaceae bacterium]|jgi:RHS repeat-associated protein|nr:DNRLRE domain-containing protein [Propionibacteriaceae bacterium]
MSLTSIVLRAGQGARALAVGAIGVTVATDSVPRLLAALAAGQGAAVARAALIAVALIGLSLALAAWLATDLARETTGGRVDGQKSNDLLRRLGRRTWAVLWGLGLWVGLAVLLSLACGVIAWALHIWFGQRLGLESWQRLVDAVVVMAALVSAPSVFALMALSLAGQDPTSRSGRAQMRRVSGRLAQVVAGTTLAGFVFWWAAVGQSDRSALLVRAGCLALVGAAALWIGLRICLSATPAAPDVASVTRRRRRIGWSWLTRWRPSPAAAKAVTGGAVVALCLSLVFSSAPPASAAPTPPPPVPAQTPAPSPDPAPPTNQPDVSTTGVELALRDPQPYYEVERPAGALTAAGDGWSIYQTGERSFSTVVGGPRATYLDQDGELAEVDDTLLPVAGGSDQAAFENAANDYDLTIPAVLTAERGVRFERDGFVLEMSPQEGDFSRPVAKSNAVLFNEVFPGVDFQYTVVQDEVKEDIVLNRVVDLTAFASTISVDGGLALSCERGAAVARATEDRGRTAAGQVVFTASAPGMVDAAGAVSDAMAVTCQPDGDQAVMTVTPSPEWLQGSARVYPVRIDPTVDIASAAVSLITVEQGSPNSVIGDNAFPYVGYDDGIASSNLLLYGNAHLMTRTYVQIDYDFARIMREARIDSATFELHHRTNWSRGQTTLGLYTVDQPWNRSVMTWNNQLGLTHTYIGQQTTVNRSSGAYLSWDVREVVNNWVQGVSPQYGLVVKALDERNMQAEVLSNKNRPSPPRLVINWSIPDPVDPNYPLGGLTVNLRPVTEKSLAGKLIVDGVFADGLAQPDAVVDYRLDPTGDGAQTMASRSYRYPNSADWDDIFPAGTHYADKLSNWQSGLFGQLELDTTYQFRANASLNGQSSPEAVSDRFLIYQVKQRDTLPFIAKYYGVPLDTLMRDNRVQDTLATDQNTLFIRNPNTTVPYNPPPLTDEQKKQIDSDLMGRGLHCEYGFEPVNFNTGDFWLQAQDLAIPDIGGDLTLTRSYNSLGQPTRSVLGFGWEFDHSQTLVRDQDGALLHTTADGKTLTFEPAGGGLYNGPVGLGLTIREIPYNVGTEQFFRFELIAADGAVTSFNAWGLVSGLTDANGSTTRLDYDANLNLVGLTSPSGVTLGFGYDAHGRLAQVTRPDGVQLSYGYDEAGDLVSFTDGNGNTVRYVYDQQHRMVEWWDQAGDRQVANSYDDLGRVTAQIDARGDRSTLEYLPGRTIATDARGLVTTHRLDQQGRTVGIDYPDGQSVTRTYDADNRLISDEFGSYSWDADGNKTAETDRVGRTSTYTWDDQGRMTSSTDPDGRVRRWLHSPAGDLLTATTPAGQETYTWDDRHRMTSHTNPLGGVETFAYTGDSAQPASRTDAAGRTWRMDYNPMNQLTALTDPTGAITRQTWDRAGQPTGRQTPDGGFTQRVLDPVGRPVQLIEPTGAITSFTYDGRSNITSATDPLGHTTSFSYDANQNLVSETDGLGATTVHRYDQRDRRVESVDPTGSVWLQSYDVWGDLVSSVDPTGAVTSYERDQALGLLTAVTDPLGQVTSYTYSPAGILTSVTQPGGAQTVFTIGADGRLTRMTEPEGKVTSFTYDAAGNITALDVNGRITTYRYDLVGNLTSSVDAAGQTATYSWDELDRPLSVTDEAGHTTIFAHDAASRLVAQTDAAGATTNYAWDLAGNLVSVTDANGHSTVNAYDPMNHLVAVTDPTGAVTSYAWDAGERLVSVTDPYDNVTRYEYDPLGRLTAATDPLGRTVTRQLDQLGRLLAETDPAGFTSTWEYDALGQATRWTRPNGFTVDFTYDGLGNVTEAASDTGVTQTYAWDTASRPVSASDTLGRTASWTHNVWGELTGEVTLDGVTIAYQRDQSGSVTRATSSAGGTTAYTRDPRGEILTQTDPTGATWTYSHDAVGRLVGQTDPLGAETLFQYDPVGNLTAMTDALGQTTSYEYDAVNRLVTVIDALGRRTESQFDAASRLVSVTRPAGDVTAYGWDAAGQLTAVADAEGGVTAYDWDPRGLLASLTDPTGATTAYQWDEVANLTAQTDPLGRTTNYAYSPASQLTSLTDPAGGVHDYTWDAADRLTSVTTPLGYRRDFVYDQAGNVVQENDSLGRRTEHSWDGLHNLLSTTDAMGGVSSFSYDSLGRPVSATDALGQSWAYQWDAASRLLQTTDPSGLSTAYSWDPLGRLNQRIDPDGAVTQSSYDAIGNLTAVTDPLGRVTSYAYDADNRPIAVTDPAGETVRMAWDGLDRLTVSTDQTGAETRLAWDGAGRQTSLTDANGHVTSYVWDAAGQLTGLRDAQGQSWSYGYDQLGQLISIDDPLGRSTQYARDAESNPTQVTSPLGAVEQWSYDPAGRVIENVKPGGAVTRYDYDELNRLVELSYPGATGQDVGFVYDALGQRVAMSDLSGQSTYRWDELGRLVGVVQGDGCQISYSYGLNGQIESITYPDGEVVAYGYDASGALTTVEDADGTSTYSYDDNSRVIGLTRPGGIDTVYQRDPRGAVSAVENSGPDGESISRYEYVFDAAGLIVGETQTVLDPDGAQTRVERWFSYDSDDRLVAYSETDPSPLADPDDSSSGPSRRTAGEPAWLVTYQYDAAGNRLEAERRDPAGELAERVEYVYDDDDRLVSADSTLTGLATYAYSGSGLLLRADSADGGRLSYEYTAADRLQAVRDGGRLLMAASYDGVGNRVFQLTRRPVEGSFQVRTGRTAGTDSVFTARDDDLLSSPAGAFWYGFAQQLAQQAFAINKGLTVQVVTDVHDLWGKSEVRLPREAGLDAADVAALEDAGLTRGDVDDLVAGGRVTTDRPVSAVDLDGFAFDLIHYVNDVNAPYAQVLQEYGQQGQLGASFTYGLERLSVRAGGSLPWMDWLTGSGESTGWYLSDGRGSVGQVVSGAGGLLWGSSYDPWGVPEGSGDASPWFGFNGEEHNPVTGLQYLRARYLDSGSGRFTQADSWRGEVAAPGSLNRFVYAESDPVNRVDPSGHFSLGGVLGAVKGAVSQAASWVNNNVVKPVVNTVRAAGSWVNQNVVQPVVGWVDQHVVQPLRGAASNAVGAAGQVLQSVGSAVARGVSAAGQMVSSTTQWVAQRTAEIRAQVEEFACSTADRLSDAWSATVDAVTSLPWDRIGQVALIVGSTALGAVATIATAGAAGPLVAGLLYAGLAATTVFAVNDVVEAVSGENLIRDQLLGGNQLLYDSISTGVGFLGGLGPDDFARFGATHADDAARAAAGLVDDVAGQAGRHGDDLLRGADDVPAVKPSQVDRVEGCTGTSCTMPGACFVAGTGVLLADGSSKPIESVSAGDEVVSWDESTGETVSSTVERTFVRSAATWTVGVSDGGMVETTAGHPFWVVDAGWVQAASLTVGDRLLEPDGSTLTVESVQATGRVETVFNFEVAGTHTYFTRVADGRWTLVHNDCDPGGTPAGQGSDVGSTAGPSKPPLERSPVGQELMAQAEDTRLRDFIGELYRPGADVGDGGTAAAIIQELATGGLVGERSHIQKGQDAIRYFASRLGNGTWSPGDQQIALNLMQSLQDALGSLAPRIR